MTRKRLKLRPIDGLELEPTFSLDQVGRHLGLGHTAISELVRYGRKFKSKLHPTRGGLYPTFKASHKSRRVPLSAIDHHKRHLARIAGDPEPEPTVILEQTEAAT